MAALNPTPKPRSHETLPPATMDDEARDALILKTIARVERIDSEVEVLIHNQSNDGVTVRGIRNDQALLIGEVGAIKRQLETIKRLLTDLLTSREP